MENNLEESDSFIEDISEDTLLTLDETLESDQESEISEAKGKVKKEDDEEDEMGEAVKVDPKDIDGKDDDDKEDDGDGMDNPGDEDSDVDNDGDSDEADSFLKKRRKAIAKNTKMKEDIELEEGTSDLKVIAKKLGLSDAEVNKLEIKSTKQYSKAKGQTMLVDILKAVEAMSGSFRKAAMHYAKTGDFGMLDMIVNDRDEDMDESIEEDSELEEGVSDKLKDLISDFIGAAGDARSDLHAGDILDQIRKEPNGQKIANDLEDGWEKIYFGRPNNQGPGRDSLSKAKGRITKAGKLNKADAAKLKSMIKAKYGMKESIDTSDIDRLCESEEGLTEEFKEKASFIFEAAVLSKVNEIEATLQEQYETRLTDEVDAIKTTLEEQVDNYLTYAVESWVEDNKVAIESSLRTQMAENFISALKNVFVENYVEVPDSKVDLFDQLDKDNQNLKKEAAKANRIAESLADRVDTLVRERVIAEAACGLADTQVYKLKKLVEDVEFVDEKAFAKKVETIKEFYLNGQSTDKETLTEGNDSYFTTETIVEGDTSDENVSPEMKAYLTALSRMNRAMTADLL